MSELNTMKKKILFGLLSVGLVISVAVPFYLAGKMFDDKFDKNDAKQVQAILEKYYDKDEAMEKTKDFLMLQKRYEVEVNKLSTMKKYSKEIDKFQALKNEVSSRKIDMPNVVFDNNGTK